MMRTISSLSTHISTEEFGRINFQTCVFEKSPPEKSLSGKTGYNVVVDIFFEDFDNVTCIRVTHEDDDSDLKYFHESGCHFCSSTEFPTSNIDGFIEFEGVWIKKELYICHGCTSQFIQMASEIVFDTEEYSEEVVSHLI